MCGSMTVEPGSLRALLRHCLQQILQLIDSKSNQSAVYSVKISHVPMSFYTAYFFYFFICRLVGVERANRSIPATAADGATVGELHENQMSVVGLRAGPDGVFIIHTGMHTRDPTPPQYTWPHPSPVGMRRSLWNRVEGSHGSGALLGSSFRWSVG